MLNTKTYACEAGLNPRMGQLLPSILVLIPILFVTVPVFAEETIVIETDSESYFTNDVMIISGYVPNWKMPVIAMSIFDPDGDILSANNVEIQNDGTFTRIITLDSPFYDKAGIYLVTVDYGKNSAYTIFEVISNHVDDEPILQPKIIPEVTDLQVNKKSYYTDEFIVATGRVSAMAEPTVLVGIYNPDGSPASFYTPDVNSDLSFSVKFLAKSGINFKTFGTYSVKAHYANTKLTTTFDFLEMPVQENVSTYNGLPPREPQSTVQDKQMPQNSPEAVPKSNVVPVKEVSQPTQAKPPLIEPKKDSTISKAGQNILANDEKAGNLTVHDEELGKMLNEIALNCDTSEFKDSLSYYDGMGPALMRLCKYEQAISYFDNALIMTPNRAEIYSNKGSALAKLGQHSMAIAYYDAALQIDPRFVPALNNKANALMQLGNVDDAISVYKKALAVDPSYSITLTNLQKAEIKRSELMIDNQIGKHDEASILIEYELPEQEMQEEHSESEAKQDLIKQLGNVFSSIGIIFGFVK